MNSSPSFRTSTVPPCSIGAPTRPDKARANASDSTGGTVSLVTRSRGVSSMPKKRTPIAISSATNPMMMSAVTHHGRDFTPSRTESQADSAIAAAAGVRRVRVRLIFENDEVQSACQSSLETKKGGSRTGAAFVHERPPLLDQREAVDLDLQA